MIGRICFALSGSVFVLLRHAKNPKEIFYYYEDGAELHGYLKITSNKFLFLEMKVFLSLLNYITLNLIHV